ncbi:hypothetical protein B5G33_09895 [Blautia sp. An81]|nr:SPFH domain-containing protein [Blautia sp. An81]OUN30160.1 hypothetical protein B5G33_09895 [Blautia sp. An81]
MTLSILFIIIIGVLVLCVLASCIQIVPQAYAVILERLGAYRTTWGTGIHFKIPFIERVSRRISLMEQVEDFPPQPVITKDNVTMQIDTVVYLKGRVPRLNNGSGVGECPAIVSGYEYKPPLLVLYGR